MFVKARRRNRKLYFYLIRSRREGKAIHQAELYVGPTLTLPAQRWLDLVAGSGIRGFPQLSIRNFLLALEAYVRKHNLPESVITGLKEAVQLVVTCAPAYHALGLEPGASAAEVQQAFRRLAKVYHPDVGGDRERFEALVRAREQIARFAPPCPHSPEEPQ